MLWIVLIMLGAAWTLQSLLGYIQIKDFNNNFNEMRKRGKVVIGKEKGKLKAGTIILMLLDNNCRIKEIRRMYGISVFARMKTLKGLDNKCLLELSDKDFNGFDKYTIKAIEDAIKNYKQFN
ncbi:transcriptional regulator GutM [Thermoanaerobacterium sp. CMT5567-10]|uniref:transcriptional regulator GutM n=1 Tax=Thermoanaerobacterium sp. CMT5567-10 TaxID=3061989 RepID=UPI0026DF667C|nr:transcriptional regulator GutM [Thermoanaerobacterium sp. CMT5567-10]WKV10225.1 transcriptional regulator GutM [Thermoanaerobacterium sp. CMT5567-10]